MHSHYSFLLSIRYFEQLGLAGGVGTTRGVPKKHSGYKYFVNYVASLLWKILSSAPLLSLEFVKKVQRTPDLKRIMTQKRMSSPLIGMIQLRRSAHPM